MISSFQWVRFIIVLPILLYAQDKPWWVDEKPSSNSNLIDLGWETKKYTSFYDGMKKTCDWFINNYPNVRGVK